MVSIKRTIQYILSLLVLMITISGCKMPNGETGITIPLPPSIDKILAADGAEQDYFGASLSISGDYLVVGADKDDDKGANSGSAYVFQKTGINTWDAGVKLLATDGTNGDNFGNSVAISMDYIVVGAAKNSNTGSAYVFHRTGLGGIANTWDSGTKLVASDGVALDSFGQSVSIDGDYIVVGASMDDDKGNNAGSAYVFHKTGTNTWDGGTKLVAADGVASDNFGQSISISGDYIVVGADRGDISGDIPDSGSAYVFHRTGTNIWDEVTELLPFDGAMNDRFGQSVSISGNYIVCGSPWDNDNGYTSGSAYVFQRTENTWDTGTKLLASGGVPKDNFGGAVAIYGDSIIVGASGVDDKGTFSGAAYVFRRTNGNTWQSGIKLLATDGDVDYYFGRSVSISGNNIIIGASGDKTKKGAAYTVSGW